MQALRWIADPIIARLHTPDQPEYNAWELAGSRALAIIGQGRPLRLYTPPQENR